VFVAPKVATANITQVYSGLHCFYFIENAKEEFFSKYRKNTDNKI
jgi:hypothetical protein